MTFKIGMKVARIPGGGDPNPSWARGLRFSFPQVGEVCTIATINEWPTKTLLTFVEHDNSHLIREFGCSIEPGFNARSFRPAVSPKQQVSFTTGAPRDSTKWDCRRKRVEVEA